MLIFSVLSLLPFDRVLVDGQVGRWLPFNSSKLLFQVQHLRIEIFVWLTDIKHYQMLILSTTAHLVAERTSDDAFSNWLHILSECELVLARVVIAVRYHVDHNNLANSHALRRL